MINKIKKYIIFPSIAIVVVYLVALLLAIPYYVEVLESYPLMELSNEKLIKYYNLKALEPKGLGFKEYHEVGFKSSVDSHVDLTGWFIPSEEKSESCFLLVHGWRANRQTTLPFAEILKKYDFNKDNNIFMVDLRNAGMSTQALTDLGYKTSYDIYDSIIFLNKNYGIKNFNIFSISMGAMATINMLSNNKNNLQKLNIKINKIILDSPLMNAKEAIKSRKAPEIFRNNLVYIPYFFVVDNRWGNYLDKLRFSYLSQKLDLTKILIFQSKVDKTTTYKVFEKELQNLGSKAKNLNIVVFEQGRHGIVFKDNIEVYEKKVIEFLNN